VWASFPGNLYNQGSRQVSWMLAQWQTLLGAQYV